VKPLIADDGLRNRTVRMEGTNRFYPCGHERTASNSRVAAGRSRCLLCQRRLERESKARRRGER